MLRSLEAVSSSNSLIAAHQEILDNYPTQQIDPRKVMLTAVRGYPEFTDGVAEILSLPITYPCAPERCNFKDGEMKASLYEGAYQSFREKGIEEIPVYILAPGHPDQFRIKEEVLQIACAAENAGAKGTYVVFTYLPSERGDKFEDAGESAPLKVTLAPLNAMGVTETAAVEIHNMINPERKKNGRKNETYQY